MGLQEGGSEAGFILVSLRGSAEKPGPSCPSLPFPAPTVAPLSFQRQWSFLSGWPQDLFHPLSGQAGRERSQQLFLLTSYSFLSLNHAPLQPHPNVPMSFCLSPLRAWKAGECVWCVCVCRRSGRWKVGEWNLKLATKSEIQYNIQDSLWGFLYQIKKKMSWQTFLKVDQIMSTVRKLLRKSDCKLHIHITYIWSCNRSFCFCLIPWKLHLITLSQVEDLTPNIGRDATPCRGTRGWGSRAGLHGHGTGCHPGDGHIVESWPGGDWPLLRGRVSSKPSPVLHLSKVRWCRPSDRSPPKLGSRPPVWAHPSLCECHWAVRVHFTCERPWSLDGDT